MHILITGSSGHLGSHITEALSARHQVMGIDRRPSPTTSYIIDIADRKKLSPIVAKTDVIVHTASLHAPHVDKCSNQRFIDTNITGTLNLLELAVEYGVKKFVYTSTTSVYGRAMEAKKQKATWVSEQLTPLPRDIYDITKLTAEQLCQDVASRHRLPIICLRTSRFWNEPESLKAIYRFYRGVDMRDLVQAHTLAIYDEKIQFDIFNISAQSPFGQHELEELYNNAAGLIRRRFPEVATLLRQRGWHLPGCIDRVYDISKAVRELGYRPEFNFMEYLYKQ